MTCQALKMAIEKKMAITINKAKFLIESRYGYEGNWNVKSVPGPDHPYRVDLHVFTGHPPFAYILADYSSMKVKAFGPFMRHLRTYYAVEVKL